MGNHAGAQNALSIDSNLYSVELDHFFNSTDTDGNPDGLADSVMSWDNGADKKLLYKYITAGAIVVDLNDHVGDANTRDLRNLASSNVKITAIGSNNDRVYFTSANKMECGFVALASIELHPTPFDAHVSLERIVKAILRHQ